MQMRLALLSMASCLLWYHRFHHNARGDHQTEWHSVLEGVSVSLSL